MTQHKSRSTWVLVADAGRARILETEGPGKPLEPVPGLSFTHEVPKTSDMVRDRQPRSFESVGTMRHPISPGPDPHRAEKARFAGELADRLDEALKRQAFAALVIVAPAQMLGDLRAALSEPVRAAVKSELDLDLTKHSDADIAARLKDHRAL